MKKTKKRLMSARVDLTTTDNMRDSPYFWKKHSRNEH